MLWAMLGIYANCGCQSGAFVSVFGLIVARVG